MLLFFPVQPFGLTPPSVSLCSRRVGHPPSPLGFYLYSLCLGRPLGLTPPLLPLALTGLTIRFCFFPSTFTGVSVLLSFWFCFRSYLPRLGLLVTPLPLLSPAFAWLAIPYIVLPLLLQGRVSFCIFVSSFPPLFCGIWVFPQSLLPPAFARLAPPLFRFHLPLPRALSSGGHAAKIGTKRRMPLMAIGPKLSV